MTASLITAGSSGRIKPQPPVNSSITLVTANQFYTLLSVTGRGRLLAAYFGGITASGLTLQIVVDGIDITNGVIAGIGVSGLSITSLGGIALYTYGQAMGYDTVLDWSKGPSEAGMDFTSSLLIQAKSTGTNGNINRQIFYGLEG